jgi:hypothetical protein
MHCQFFAVVLVVFSVTASVGQEARTRVYTPAAIKLLDSSPGVQFEALSVSDTGLDAAEVVDKLSSAASSAGLELVMQGDRILMRTPGHQRVGMSSPHTQGSEVICNKMTNDMFVRVDKFVSLYNQMAETDMIKFIGVELVLIADPHSSNNPKWTGENRWDYSCICTVALLIKR